MDTITFDPGRYDAPTPAPAPPVPAPPAPLAPTSPPIEPNRSRDVQTQIDTVYAKLQAEPNERKRAPLRDELLALHRAKLGPDNVKKFELGRDPASPPEPEVSTGRPWQPSVQPMGGLTFDDGKLDIAHAVGRTLGFTPAETQTWADEAARSTRRVHLPESSRLAQTQTALEAAWGVPKDSPQFQMRLGHSVETLGHYPGLWEDAQRAGMDLDAFVYLEADRAYIKAHPRP